MMSAHPALTAVPDAPAAWAPEDYGPWITASGADKLTSSAVAPLVALAAGAVSVVQAESLSVAVRRANAAGVPIGMTNSKEGRWLGNNIATGDAMLMPWHSAAAVCAAQPKERKAGTPVVAAQVQVGMWQARPRSPLADGRKYDTLGGSRSVVAAHPSTPFSWLSNPTRVAITEGWLKAGLP